MNSTLENNQLSKLQKRILLGTSAISALLLMSACSANAEEANEELAASAQSVEIISSAAGAGQDSAEMIDEDVVIVMGKTVTFANNTTDNVMMEQESSAASVLSVIDNLPGVSIGEGAAFGSDDWSTTISMRGFNVGLSEQQIGMTIDGLPNGNSNYGGGSKANRYIDFENLSRAEVSQGTSDISSASHEALGGTINFVTNNPEDEERLRAGISMGDNNAQRYFFRYDTGDITDRTKAYLSYSRQSNDAWIGDAGYSDRDHFAAKFVSDLDEWTLTGRVSWDEAHEDNFQRISLDQFNENPDWDRLTDVITGIPYVDQAYRPSWSTLRTNYFAYLRSEYDGENVNFEFTPYYHNQKGRGDWVPQYVVNVAGGTTNFPAGVSDLHTGVGTIYGGSFDSAYSFEDSDGTPLAPNDSCTATLTFPYGGGETGDNPACYDDGANPASSYRHTHYNKERIGLTTKVEYEMSEENTLRAGAWWEHANRDESRDWHRIIDPRSSHEFDHAAYWRQYDRNFVTNTLMLYAEDTLTIENFTFNAGLRKFIVNLKRKDNFGIEEYSTVDADSKILFTAGAIYEATDDIELFAGFSQNFAAIKDSIIEGSAELSEVEGEKADNFDVGIRVRNDWLRMSITGYYIKFSNRIVGIPVGDISGIDYASQIDTVYQNVGGIESKGLEASISADLWDYWNIYSSLTVNNSEYTETVGNVEAGKKVALSPELQAVASLSYAKDGVFGGVSAKYVGERYGDFENKDRLPSHALVDLWVGYNFEMNNGFQNMKVSLNVNNLMDKRYLGGGTPGGYFIGAGRQVMGNITLDF
ncbi:TonB-dependent receptor domain-containing protein [Pseudemcibacter aquimaris]|uniref:TonB-dependent receptor domain-containing protein n=1 Tax=Pseudemcibacter aquimaris TaxID=2857064 RepID=UPI0020137AA2|nr:TonB-dependent receptor [Pseudemcibacter aquimaris]MCC3860254.1 TonB-dependent receptor [Pseudemcibacter aquimaris]WDU57579.1 TonB-dependent receptor [Pseudemcibacter aquimaris]